MKFHRAFTIGGIIGLVPLFLVRNQFYGFESAVYITAFVALLWGFFFVLFESFDNIIND